VSGLSEMISVLSWFNPCTSATLGPEGRKRAHWLPEEQQARKRQKELSVVEESEELAEYHALRVVNFRQMCYRHAGSSPVRPPCSH
jgi:hypothetical protein